MSDEILEYALQKLNNNNWGELILPIRKKIWLALGEIKSDGKKAVITSGLLKRVFLARACVEKVIQQWEIEFGDMNELKVLIENIDLYLNGSISFFQLERMKNEYLSRLQDSYLISLVYSADDNENLSKTKRKEFWKWYIQTVRNLLQSEVSL